MKYANLPQDYARRATDLAADGSPESLFYAAIEIRLGTEARLRSYVNARDCIEKAKKKGWKVQHLAKGLESAFVSANKVVAMRYVLENADVPQILLRFTPVTKALQKVVQRLSAGN